MATTERRNGNSKVMRTGSERRVCKDPNYKGPEQRYDGERRAGKDRRKRG